MLYANSGIIIKPEENAEELMYQASHYELVASAEAIKAGHELSLIHIWQREQCSQDYQLMAVFCFQ